MWGFDSVFKIRWNLNCPTVNEFAGCTCTSRFYFLWTRHCVSMYSPCFHVSACEVRVCLPRLSMDFRWHTPAVSGVDIPLISHQTEQRCRYDAHRLLLWDCLSSHISGDYGALLSHSLCTEHTAATTPSVKRYINAVHISTRSQR